MKKIVYLLLLLAAAHLESACDHKTKSTNNWTAPMGRITFAPSGMSDFWGYSLMGEAGVKVFRGSLTSGFQLSPEHRFKATGEYLVQKLGYNFSSGKSHRWMHQAAGGAEYQYLMSAQDVKALNLKGYYAYSPSRSLQTVCCGFSEFNFRKIAGANAYGFSGGAVLTPGSGNHLLLAEINYDNVKYRRSYNREVRASGVGISLDYTLRFFRAFDINLQTQFRHPFNFYSAKILWRQSGVTAGFFASYTQGKYHLPSVTAIGIELTCSLGFSSCRPRLDFGNCSRPLWDNCNLGSWLLIPAVYMPEVLAITDSLNCRSCESWSVPRSSPFSVPPQTSPAVSIDIAQLGNFRPGDGSLVYEARGLPPGLSIDTRTGVISGNYQGGNETFSVSVTAGNRCGSTTQNFALIFLVVNEE